MIFPSGIAAPVLTRRKLGKLPHLGRRFIDPQLYLSDIAPTVCRSTCTNLSSYGWFEVENLRDYNSAEKTQNEWRKETAAKIHRHWKSRLPSGEENRRAAILSCVVAQRTLGCEQIILPAPMTMEQNSDCSDVFAWLDEGLSVASTEAKDLRKLATIAVSDNAIRGLPPQSNTLLDLIVDQITARSFDGAYVIIEQVNESGYYCTHPNTIGALLHLVARLKHGGLATILVSQMGTAGLLALAAGADAWSAGWYRGERRLKKNDLEDTEGRATPTYYSHQLASEVHLEKDVDRLASLGALADIEDETPASKGLLDALRSGKRTASVPQWVYRPSNISAARAHFMMVAVRETGRLSKLSFRDGLDSTQHWLERAEIIASNMEEQGGFTPRTELRHQASGFAIPENVLLQGSTLLQVSGTSSLSGSLTLLGGGIIDSVGGTLTVSGAITGSGGLTKNDNGNLILSGSNHFTGAFTSNGGTVTLSGANTFDGGLTINAGTVVLAADQAYTGGTTIVQGTLQLGSGNTATSGNVGAGDILLSPSYGQTATLNILRGDNTLNITNNITSSGTGTNAVTIGATGASSQSGIVTFSGMNTFTGNVTINGGALRITNGSALGVGPKTVNVQANSRPALLLDGSGGNIVLAAGINFNVSSDGSTGTAVNNAGGIVNLAGDNIINGNIALTNGGGGNGRISVTAGTLTLTGLIDATNATGARTLLLGGAGNGKVSGLIADWFDSVGAANHVVSISKDGAGTWFFTGANTFTGTVAVTEGTLNVNAIDGTATNAQPLGTGTGAITLGATTTTGTLEYTGAAATLSRPVTVGGVGGGVIRNSGGQLLTLAGAITTSGRPLTLTGGPVLVTGQIAGTAANSNVIVDGVTVTLSGANTYNGATQVINGGTLQNGATDAVPTTTSTVTLGETTNNTSATYDLNGFNQTLKGLASAGTGTLIVTNNAASGTSTLTQTGTSTFAGEIQDGATATVAVTKSTGGTFTLSGTSTYTGATEISGGTLLVSGSLHGTVNVAVDSGGTLAGKGTITTGNDGNVTVASGGFLSPGNNNAGKLALALGLGQLDLSGAAGGTGWLKFDLGTTSDQVALTSGTLNIGTGLDLDDFSFTGVAGFGVGTYTLFNTSQPIVGELGSNLSGTVLGFDATLQYADGGNDLVLVVVPEPGTVATLIGGVATLLGWQRSRRRRSAYHV